MGEGDAGFSFNHEEHGGVTEGHGVVSGLANPFGDGSQFSSRHLHPVRFTRMFSSPDSSLRRFARLASSLVALALVGPANALPPTREDVPQVLRSLQDKDVAVSSQACYDVSEMAARKLFAPENLPTLWEGLRPQLRSQHADSSELSARAVQALVRDSGLFTSAFWPGQEGTLRREPSQADRLAASAWPVCLTRAF